MIKLIILKYYDIKINTSTGCVIQSVSLKYIGFRDYANESLYSVQYDQKGITDYN